MMNTLEIKGKKIPLPIIQGGMGVGVSREKLASAVIKEGGVGTISASQIGFVDEHFFDNAKEAYRANVSELKKSINKVRETADGFLAVNILTASRQYNELAQAAVDAGADAIVSGAGLPLDLPKATKGTNTAAIPIVSSARALNLICRRWEKRYGVLPDAVVVEGPKAGGHLGVKYEELDQYEEKDNLDERFLEVKKYCVEHKLNVPIIVAGGIFTSADAKKYFDLGVDAIQVGTRFIATEECDAHDDLKNRFIKAKKEDIVYVKSPVGYPGRGIKNEFVDTLNKGNIPVEKCLACVLPCGGKVPETPYCITDHLIKAVQGDIVNGLIFSGANGYMIDKISTVEVVIKDLLSQVRRTDV